MAAALERLADPDEEVRGAAAAVLIAAGEVEAVLEFLREHRHDDVPVRVEATRVLGELADPRAIDLLVDVGTDVGWDDRHRNAAADALARIGPPAVDRLLDLATSDVSVEQALAARALGQIGDLRAAPALSTLVAPGRPRHPKPFVRHAAHRALVALTGEDFGHDGDAWREWIDARASQDETTSERAQPRLDL